MELVGGGLAKEQILLRATKLWRVRTANVLEGYIEKEYTQIVLERGEILASITYFLHSL